MCISENITVKELREFISKDFNIPINNLNFYCSSEGFLKDSFEFKFKQDNIINLDLSIYKICKILNNYYKIINF